MAKTKETSLAPVYYWNPSTIFEEMERKLNERSWDLDRFWLPSMLRNSYRIPAIDVREEDARYVVKVELPGMAREDVNIEVGEGALDITAKKETESEEHGHRYIRKERGSMSFHRRLVLPDDVDPEGVEAKLSDGVLELVLPKIITEGAKKKVDV